MIQVPGVREAVECDRRLVECANTGPGYHISAVYLPHQRLAPKCGFSWISYPARSTATVVRAGSRTVSAQTGGRSAR